MLTFERTSLLSFLTISPGKVSCFEAMMFPLGWAEWLGHENLCRKFSCLFFFDLLLNSGIYVNDDRIKSGFFPQFHMLSVRFRRAFPHVRRVFCQIYNFLLAVFIRFIAYNIQFILLCQNKKRVFCQISTCFSPILTCFLSDFDVFFVRFKSVNCCGSRARKRGKRRKDFKEEKKEKIFRFLF